MKSPSLNPTAWGRVWGGGFGGSFKGLVSNLNYITAFEIISWVLHFEHEADCVPELHWMPWAEMESLSSFLVPVGCLTKRSRVKPLHILRRWLRLTPYCRVLVSHYIRTLPMMHTEPVSEKLLYFNHLTQLSARENFIECGRPESFNVRNTQSSFHDYALNTQLLLVCISLLPHSFIFFRFYLFFIVHTV